MTINTIIGVVAVCALIIVALIGVAEIVDTYIHDANKEAHRQARIAAQYTMLALRARDLEVTATHTPTHVEYVMCPKCSDTRMDTHTHACSDTRARRMGTYTH